AQRLCRGGEHRGGHRCVVAGARPLGAPVLIAEHNEIRRGADAMRPMRLVPLAAALAAALGASGASAQSLLALYEAARAQDAAWQSARAQYEANLARAEQSLGGILPTA